MASAVKRLGRHFAITMMMMAAAVAGAAAPVFDLQTALDAASPTAELAIIVTYRGELSAQRLRKSLANEEREFRRREIVTGLKQAASSANAPLVDLMKSRGARDVRILWIANAVALRATPDLVRTLLADPRVLQVRMDAMVPAPIPYAGDPVPVEWNINMIRAAEAWQRGIRGDGVVIASLDTGVDALHPDLAARWRGGTNSWFDPYGEHVTPRDLNGHGTQAMGIIVGGSAGGSAIGVAPDASWIAAKIFNDAGDGSESAMHLAFQWLLDPDGNPATDDAPDVVNNSWGMADEGICNSLFQPDIDALRAADISVVFSAGNYGPAPATSVSPGNNNQVQSVGAVDFNQEVVLYSSRGPSACDGTVYPKLVAPGDSVLTADLSFGGTPNYTLVSGTSFAAPHVAGVVALLRQAAPHASVEEIDAALEATAHDLGAPGPDDDAGYGLVDAVAAIDALEGPTDDDRDGFDVRNDCNDLDPRIHPGASERRADGIDQDCNGFDLTIRVHYAVYSHDGSSLRVRATSALGASAALEVVDVGPLVWRKQYRDWIMAGAAGGAPRAKLTIRGPEGEITVTARQPTRRR